MISKIKYITISVMIVFYVLNFAETSSAKLYENYMDFFNDIKSLSIDLSKAYPVKEYFITRDVANISLDSGVVYVCNPINNRYCSAVFIGTGTLMFEPPIKVERDQLERFLKTKSLNAKFSAMLLFCGDSIIYEIMRDNLPDQGKKLKHTESMIKDFLLYETNKEKTKFNKSITKTLLEDEYNDMFYSFFDMDDYDNLFFCIDPYEDEEISLFRGDYYPVFGKFKEVINQFHYINEYSNGEYVDSLVNINDEVEIVNYKIDAKIINFNDERLNLSCKTKVTFVALREGLIWLPLHLYKNIFVISIKSENGQDLKFYKGENSSDLWIKNEKENKVNDTFSINIEYFGAILENKYNYVSSETSFGWYPNYGSLNKSLFDITFHTPAEYQFVSIGDLISESKDSGIYTSHWVTPHKCRNASFTIGKYGRKPLKVDAGTPGELLYITDYQRINVAIDVQQSMSFFTKLFGILPIKKFFAAITFGYSGEAFPGLVNLPSHFSWSVPEGGIESFYSHEVAHQWWGINVDFKSYRDRWLSEGFAEYVSLMYTQMVLKDNEKFFKILSNSKERLINLRKSFLGKGFEQGPIALGHRLISTKAPGDYSLIIYEKGAWVLHMLRNMLIDLNNFNENSFLKILSEFYNAFKGKNASTRDFENIIEKNTGIDFSWFFDQWVYDTKIPNYTYSIKTEKAPNDKYIVRIRVKQEYVPPTFKMFVPIAIYGENDEVVRFRTFITNEVSEFDLPPIPFEPDKIQFNEFESVLCDYDEESWD